MTCEHSSTGYPDCPIRECRTRWLVGSTTAEPYQPGTLACLLADILETYQSWFTERQLWDQVQRIRPEVDLQGFRKEVWRLRQHGGATVGGSYVRVESRFYSADPWSTSSTGPNWALHAR